MTKHYAFVLYKLRNMAKRQVEKRRKMDKIINLNINLMTPVICLEVS